VKGARGKKAFRVFTTRADTIFGATYLAAAPDHSPWCRSWRPQAKKAELQAFAEKVRRAVKEVGEGAQAAEKEGMETGIPGAKPVHRKGESPSGWPISCSPATAPARSWRCLPTTSAITSSPRSTGCPIVPVVRPADGSEPPKEKAYTDYGELFDSGEFSGMPSEQARLAIAAEAQRRGIGKPAVNYHLRDWGISRQRYWGTPIPIVYMPEGRIRKGRAFQCPTRSFR